MRIASAFLPVTCYLLLVTSASAEQIADFTAHIEMRGDGTVAVQEEILYDFGAEARHGIFREIPLVTGYPGDEEGEIELANIAVTDEAGHSLDVKTEGGGNYLKLRIGDPHVTVTGRHLYVIRYTVYGAIRHLPTVDELYWNVTGNDWPVAITRSRIEVILPKEFPDNEVTRACYKGPVGSTEGCELDVATGSATGTVSAVRALALGMGRKEGVTIAVGVPKGVIAETTLPGGATRKTTGPRVILPLLIPVAVFIAMFRLWWARGRDPEGKGVIVAEYAPPEGLTPLEATALTHETIGNDAISAEIVSLATRGYLTIRKIEKKGLIFTDTDYALDRKKLPHDLPDHDRELMNGLFGMDDVFTDGPDTMLLSRLKESGKMPGVVASVKSKVYDKLTADGFFEKDPQSVRTAYIVTGIALCVLGFFVLPALILSGVVVCAFGWFMPRVTERGAAARNALAGFKRYLSVAEKDRLEFFDSPEKAPEYTAATFEKFLPYAMALGVTEIWSEQFAGVFTEEKAPAWYGGGGNFSSVAFASAMNDFSSASASSMSPGGGASGGGGFSGGGGGGGGGGSW